MANLINFQLSVVRKIWASKVQPGIRKFVRFQNFSLVSGDDAYFRWMLKGPLLSLGPKFLGIITALCYNTKKCVKILRKCRSKE